MKPLRRLTNLLAACAVAAAALIQPALAADLAQDPFITDNAQRQHYEPGGKYHLFGDPRGSVSDRTGKINVIQDYTHQMGNLLIQQANINGTIGYHTRFSGHGHEEHAPFDNHAADSASEEQGNVDEGFTVYRLNWEGHEHHPADAYDGPKGGNYPKPTGARDEYTYHVNGTARSIKLNPTDTRSIRQRISDNYSNLGSNFSDRADEANRKMFEHNAKLDRWGNSMEFINGVAAGALNPFISAGEALGIGDILYGTRYAIDKAAMRNIAPLPAEGKFAVIGGLGSVAGFEKNTREAVDRWIQENPNAAETVEAVFNVAAAAKVAKLAKAAKPGKAAVSGDFADSYKKKLALSDSARQLYQNAKYREALDIHYEDLIRRKTDGSSKFINGREIDAVTNDALIQAKRTISAIDKPKNFLNQKNRKQIKATIEAANQQGKRAEFWFKYGVHSQVKSYIESKGGIVKTGLGD
ncbi:TPA: polymorphic toxin MafB class 1 [Neisseria meningitidis]|uniref:polymorphic toxin MafB class 1 n=1 Tax=Neisseria meningitidis TaxID=487 RepID=UPI000E584399|nr:polymorphic toxin MafB class 1 [Neisseria meningitidis]MBH2049201.1 polymorphic toxin MafB class 1 [Neisseria meningitidis]MBH2082593.1 polymorphic toxin MafB class 1 [Neisseria meningitidis]MBH2250774.1 polymorphic toxin MafB class 1 [Neisseria meningitidis]MBH5611432.1 polymorphic toxin MafB class 1 [Neisseria meningitidis]MBH5667063.1 polymorphic toxin MafB class 1 [Neisseria meningitidis]